MELKTGILLLVFTSKMGIQMYNNAKIFEDV